MERSAKAALREKRGCGQEIGWGAGLRPRITELLVMMKEDFSEDARFCQREKEKSEQLSVAPLLPPLPTSFGFASPLSTTPQPPGAHFLALAPPCPARLCLCPPPSPAHY
eukprot:399810-Rhodomonas_salina.2